MHTNKMLLTLLASVVLPLSGVACGGSSEPVGADDADHVTPAPSASSQDDAGAPSSNGNGGASTGNDAGATTTSGNDAGTSTGTTTNDAGTGPTFAANCRVTPANQTLCAEDVSGHAGDVVEIAIDLIGGGSACTEALEASANLLVSDNFALANPIQHLNCVTRDTQASSLPDDNEILWDAFGGGAIAECPNDIHNGRLDVVQVQILPGTPNGDYDVIFSSSDVASSDPACGSIGNGINGHIHVY